MHKHLFSEIPDFPYTTILIGVPLLYDKLRQGIRAKNRQGKYGGGDCSGLLSRPGKAGRDLGLRGAYRRFYPAAGKRRGRNGKPETRRLQENPGYCHTDQSFRKKR